MTDLRDIYKVGPALMTDLYELTMAQGYWKLDRLGDHASFHLYFRSLPFDSGYAIAAGLEFALGAIESFTFGDDELTYLAGLTGNDDGPLFEKGFLDFLHELTLTVDVHAAPEGSVVMAFEPLVRVTGPLLQCQILESLLLNVINFQTLIATKASRVCQAAGDSKVLEFGLRRAQGLDGGISAARAAYIGGCDATSNVQAGQLLGIPVKGTHAHSWVMSFETELESFRAYAEAMGNNCIFLVDTYDSIEGTRNAITVARELRDCGHEMVGIRLDSGDLAYLSLEARKLLDQAGFEDAIIVASSDLDEEVIDSLNQQGHAIDAYGVGTKLVTAYDEPALGGVYKLAALKPNGSDRWQYTIKISERQIKVNVPGLLQVRRFGKDGRFVADMIYDEQIGPGEPPVIVDPGDPVRTREIDDDAKGEDLLQPVVRRGRRCYDCPPLAQVRDRAAKQLASLHPGIRRRVNPHEYPAGLERQLARRRMELIEQARSRHGEPR